jgi:hypothetical protein
MDIVQNCDRCVDIPYHLQILKYRICIEIFMYIYI